jgi:hypothetical protein
MRHKQSQGRDNKNGNPHTGAWRLRARMTAGERRLAERLEDKLDDDYLLWYDVPMGPRNAHPDFCVMHPRRGILVLEVKNWKLSTIGQADKQTWEIIPDGIPKTVINPLEQARQYAHQVVGALERDPKLVQPDGPHAGKLAFPWSYGVVFTNNTRWSIKLHWRSALGWRLVRLLPTFAAGLWTPASSATTSGLVAS